MSMHSYICITRLCIARLHCVLNDRCTGNEYNEYWLSTGNEYWSMTVVL